MKESIKKWNTSLPRKDWIIQSVIELEMGDSSPCDWCHTEIRFIYNMYHPETHNKGSAGCICAGHLIENKQHAVDLQKQYRKQQSEKRKAAKKLARRAAVLNQRVIVRNRSGWRQTPQGSYTKFVNGSWSTVYETVQLGDNGWKWVRNRIHSRDIYQDEAAAMDALYAHLKNTGLKTN